MARYPSNEKYFLLHASEYNGGILYSINQVTYWVYKRHRGHKITYHNFRYSTTRYGFDHVENAEEKLTYAYIKGLQNGKIKRVGLD